VKQLIYKDGPPSVRMGKQRFRIDEPEEVSDELAETLLEKSKLPDAVIKFKEFDGQVIKEDTFKLDETDSLRMQLIELGVNPPNNATIPKLKKLLKEAQGGA